MICSVAPPTPVVGGKIMKLSAGGIMKLSVSTAGCSENKIMLNIRPLHKSHYKLKDQLS